MILVQEKWNKETAFVFFQRISLNSIILDILNGWLKWRMCLSNILSNFMTYINFPARHEFLFFFGFYIKSYKLFPICATIIFQQIISDEFFPMSVCYNARSCRYLRKTYDISILRCT